MPDVYLFDVDGTLTPPRQTMSKVFAEFFGGFVKRETVFLVSGSDYQKIKEQVPLDILNNCKGIFGCSGAEYIERDQVIYRREYRFSDELVAAIERFVSRSPYPHRRGNHIEQRPGMLNVSVVGRNASLEEREHYHEWDQVNQERLSFASDVVKHFDGYEATCGGEISIDIVPSGWNKSVVKNEVLAKLPGSQLTFFGDRMGPNGNDKPLADVLNTPSGRHKAIAVEDYKDTWINLKHLSDATWAKPIPPLDNLKKLFTSVSTFHRV